MLRQLTKVLHLSHQQDLNVTAGAVSLSDTVVQGITTDSGAINMAGNAISVLGGEGIDVTHSGTTITIAGELATGSNAGVASFDAADFNVSSGVVTIKAGWCWQRTTRKFCSNYRFYFSFSWFNFYHFSWNYST